MNLKNYIGSIPVYPKKRILYRDITTLIKDENDAVLIIDDLIATGGTTKAAAKLVKISKAKVGAFIFINNLFDLGGFDNLVNENYQIENLIDFPGH
jgi:adenine phosphoribosyltransferase